ncbi:FAD-linked reductase, partial [Tilletiopsis washingtonensis]
VVVGAGVIGLTAALELRAHGHAVHVVARDMPHDAASTQFASPWAGANCVSYAADDDLLQQRWERTTWKRLAGISRRHPDLVQKIPFELYSAYLAANQPWWKDSECGAGTSLMQPDTALIVNASALGSRWLADVLDEKVVPARGQTVLVRAPDVRLMEEAAKSQPTYIIPRAGSGQVILGGTFEAGWANEAVINEATTDRILADCTRLCPALAECEVISVNVGLRPVRLGGTRLEPDRLANGVDVVHCYGAGPAGYQQSWG